MALFIVHLIPFLLILNLVNSIKLLQPKILVQEGGSYFQMVTDTNLAISSCTAIFKQNNSNVMISLDFHNKNVSFSDNFMDSFNFKDRIQSLGFGRCGFKVDNSTFNDPVKWIIVVANAVPEKTYNSSFSVGVYSKKQTAPLRSVKSVHLGTTTTMLCGIEYTPRLYCNLYNPQGELVSNDCTYTFAPTAEDIGTWICKVGVVQSIEALKYTIELKIEGKSTSHNWLDETDEYVSFGCRIKNWKRYEPPSYCTMTSPSGEKFLLWPGHATSRYTSVYTDLKENICGLEIKKPLLDSEKGPWTCEIENRGNIIFVGNESDYNLRNVSFKPIIIKPRQKFLFSCKVPESYSKCFILDPKGNLLLPDVISRAELGECALIVHDPHSEFHNGTWTCYFIKDSQLDAYKQQRDVIVITKNCTYTVLVDDDSDEASMGCSTTRNPVDYCWFISPKGRVYNLKSGYNNSEISYVGKGLEDGDCGLKIHKMQPDDVRVWNSITLHDDETQRRQHSVHRKRGKKL
nr:uncharacterized protein LOC111429500 [Onthophagus taurus]